MKKNAFLQLRIAHHLRPTTSYRSVMLILAAIEFVSHHNLNECFLDYSGDEHVGSKKDKIKQFMEQLNFSPEATYYIGDAGTDVEAGRAAGVNTVAVTWGFQGQERLLEAKPDFIVDSPDELLRILD